MTSYDENRILTEFVGILQEMTGDWDTGHDVISIDTNIIDDLGFESVDIVQLVVAIESHFQRRDFPFDKLLMRDGRYVEDLSVRDAVNFLQAHLNGVPA
jgi:acyl carrier protein